MLERVSDVGKALRVWPREFALQLVVGDVFESQRLDRFERTQSFEQRFLERAADRHHFADRLHLRAEHVFRFAKLFEVPLRNLGDDVIDRRLERRRSFARDVVGNLVERVTDGEFRGDLRDRKTGRF